MGSGFVINRGKGFQIRFENGTVVSVQFGPGNYCQNRDLPSTYGQPTPEWFECPNAEIAIFPEDRNVSGWLTRKFDKTLHDDVDGYCDPERVAKAIAWAARYDAKLGKKLKEANDETV